MSKEREVLLEALEWMEELKYVWVNSRNSVDYDLLELIGGINKIEQLLAQPETKQEPLTPRQGLTEYKKGYQRGFDAAHEYYKQKVINAFGVDDE